MQTDVAWFLGYWATQYETHPPEEVNVALYVLVIWATLSSLLLNWPQLHRCVLSHRACGSGRRRVRRVLLRPWELESDEDRSCEAGHLDSEYYAAVSYDSSLGLAAPYTCLLQLAGQDPLRTYHRSVHRRHPDP